MPKEKAAGGKKKTAKGDLRRNKLHIPHPVRRLRRTGVVRSVVPPFPTRIASLDSRGSHVPFANPLKTTRKGAAPPSLNHPRSLVCAEIIPDLQNAIQMRIWQTGEVIEILCVCFDFHTSNIQRARTKRLARRIVRLGNPILKPPEGRSLRTALSVNGTQKQSAFSGATALFRTPASLFCILFSDKPEKSMSAKRYSTNWVQKGGCNAISARIS